MWIAMLPAGKSFVLIAAAFLLFRLFDVWKPWPICWLDSKLPGEWGVMADDILAGIYAAVGVILLVMYAGIA
jgi:phosphatidylglycerophosphatase A